MKPNKWGYKVFVLSNVRSFSYKLEVYTEKENFGPRLPGEPECGASENVVVRLCRMIPRGAHHKVYFDNYFNCPSLQVYLERRCTLHFYFCSAAWKKRLQRRKDSAKLVTRSIFYLKKEYILPFQHSDDDCYIVHAFVCSHHKLKKRRKLKFSLKIYTGLLIKEMKHEAKALWNAIKEIICRLREDFDVQLQYVFDFKIKDHNDQE